MLPYEDGIDCIEALNSSGIEPDVFAFCDPPYVHDAPRLYEKSFNLMDHRRLAKALQTFQGAWVVTYDDVPIIRELYADKPMQEIHMQHHAGQLHVDSELHHPFGSSLCAYRFTGAVHSSAPVVRQPAIT